jgi:hypothetical protein
MAEDLNLNVNFNAQAQAGPTEIEVSKQGPQAVTTPKEDENLNQALADRALVIGTAWNVGKSTIGNYGNITGDFAGQKQLNMGIQLGAYGLGVAVAPLAGTLLAVSAGINTGVSVVIELRNDRIQVVRYTQVNRNRKNNGRW